MPRPGPPYTPEFRAEAVRLLRSSGKTVAELSRELGVSEATLRRWRLQAGDDVAEAASPINDEGKDRPVRRLARLTAEVIEAGVTVVTLPARWAANGLRWYADQGGVPPRGTSSGPHAGGDSAGE